MDMMVEAEEAAVTEAEEEEAVVTEVEAAESERARINDWQNTYACFMFSMQRISIKE